MKILPRMNTDRHGCFGFMLISQTMVLSFPCEGAGRIAQSGILIGNLKYKEVRVYREENDNR